MKRPVLTASALAMLATVGVLVALAAAPAAAAYTLPDLPGLGYTINAVGNTQTGCTDYWASGNGAPSTDLGSTDPNCTDQHALQANVDALVAAFPPPPPATTTAPDTTPASTTAPVTTTQPPPPATTTPACDVQCQIDAINVQLKQINTELTSLEQILESWPNIDPAILAQLMSLGT